MERVAIFVDGGYVKRVLRDYFGGKDINHGKFSDLICDILQLKRLRTYYYNCMPIKRRGKKEDETTDYWRAV